MKNKVLIFIDVAAPKNLLQTEVIMEQGYDPFFFVTNYNAVFEKKINRQDLQIILKSGFLKRLQQVRYYFKKNKNSIHHIEVYPGGRFSFLYILLGKLYKIRSICAERGDLLYYHKKGYSKWVRFSMWYCYKFSDLIWYREPYMKPILKKYNKKIFFLHNAIKVNSTTVNSSKRDITFLWLNRVIPERRYDWYIDVLSSPDLKQTKNYLVGIITASYKKEQECMLKNKPENLSIIDFTATPEQFYKRSKFFVLPSEVVFANHALLEAMSYGVVPIVSEQPGSSLIIDNGKNGFIFNHNKNDFETAILKAFNLPDEEYNNLSTASSQKIKNEFSEEKYKVAIKEMYCLI